VVPTSVPVNSVGEQRLWWRSARGVDLCSFNDLNGNKPSRAANPDEGGSVLLAW